MLRPAAARSAAGAPVRFADAGSRPRLDRSAQAFTLADGTKVELSSWRFEPAPGRSKARNTYWCGVAVDGEALTVIGVGLTETVSCDGLADAGALPKGRIGLIYRTSSPNAQSLTSVILTKVGGTWAVDGGATKRLFTLSPPTLAAMRRVVH
jgi:hypothetical protein